MLTTSSESNRSAALALAQVITRKSDIPEDSIARRGSCSIFSVLLATCPPIIQNGNSRDRKGVSEIEFNKLLQVCRE